MPIVAEGGEGAIGGDQERDDEQGEGGGSQSYRDSWGNFTMKRSLGSKESSWLNLELVDVEP